TRRCSECCAAKEHKSNAGDHGGLHKQKIESCSIWGHTLSQARVRFLCSLNNLGSKTKHLSRALHDMLGAILPVWADCPEMFRSVPSQSGRGSIFHRVCFRSK